MFYLLSHRFGDFTPQEFSFCNFCQTCKKPPYQYQVGSSREETNTKLMLPSQWPLFFLQPGQQSHLEPQRHTPGWLTAPSCPRALELCEEGQTLAPAGKCSSPFLCIPLCTIPLCFIHCQAFSFHQTQSSIPRQECKLPFDQRNWDDGNVSPAIN